MLGDKSNYQAQLQLNIAAVIRASQATAIDSIDEKLMALQQELIQKANSKEDYDEIADEISSDSENSARKQPLIQPQEMNR